MRISDWRSDVCSSDLRAKLEAQGGIHAHRIQKLAAHEFDARDVGLRRPDVFLYKGDAVDGGLKGLAIDVVFQRLDAVEQLHAQAFARAVVLGDERSRHRSEERRVGKECVSTCRYRWAPS